MTSEELERARGFLSDAATWGDECAITGLDLLNEVERLQISVGDYKLAADQNYAGYELMCKDNERLRAALHRIALSHAVFPERDIAEDALAWPTPPA